MKPWMKGNLVVPLWCAMLASGCATKELWQQQAFREPSSPPNLRLTFDRNRNDVLVTYDETNDRATRPRLRAYFLFQNLKRVESQHKPTFVDPTIAASLSPLQMVGLEPLSPTETDLELCAVVAANEMSFKLFSKGRQLGEFYLPVYKDGVWQTQKALLMPLAVGADATIVGGVLGMYWIEAGGPGVNCR
jgi:hypothetical protein